MTVINQSELAQLSKLDQALMWAVMSINASNLDSRNTYIVDNAAIRAESANYITWQVVQDDKGNGRFTFSALLPIVNPHPLQDKVSLLSRVWSYSPYDPSMITEDGITGYGWNLPELPTWIDTTEKLLAYLAVLATKISKYALLTKGTELFIKTIKSEYWGNCQYQITDSAYGSQMIITGYLTIDWHKYLQGNSLIRCLNPYSGHASNVNCNFPDLLDLWSVPTVDLTIPPEEITPLIPVGEFSFAPGGGVINIAQANSAEGLIDSYRQSYFNDDAVPDWYLDAINNPPTYQQLYSEGSAMSNADAEAPKIIESLPTCKEQDPAVVSYGKSPLASILGK
jgi:hypothetical protein